MFENLEQLVRDNAQELVVNNNAVPDEKNEEVIKAASGSIIDSLQSQLSGGNITEMIQSFSQGGASSVVQNATSNFTDKLGALGINSDTAKNIGASLIPMIVSKLFSGSANSNGGGFNFQDMLGKIAGGADGKFDMNDVLGMFGKKDDNSGEQQGGGLMDKLKDIF